MASEKRLIDTSQYKSFLKRYIKELYEVDAPMIAGAVERCLYKLEAQPTVYAVEVGRWEFRRSEKYSWCTDAVCTACETVIDTHIDNDVEYRQEAIKKKLLYCPHCGAKMDGERKDNERKAD